VVRQRSRMSPEASQIQRGIRRQHWGPARNVQPTILTLRLRIDHVFAVLYLTPIDCDDDRTLRALRFGMPRETER
jgi:hypothetical protein